MLTYQEILKHVFHNSDYGVIAGKYTKDYAKKVAIMSLIKSLSYGTLSMLSEDDETVVEYFYLMLDHEQTKILLNLQLLKRVLGSALFFKYEEEFAETYILYKKAVGVYDEMYKTETT